MNFLGDNIKVHNFTYGTDLSDFEESWIYSIDIININKFMSFAAN